MTEAEQIEAYTRMALERGGTVNGQPVQQPKPAKTKLDKPKLVEPAWALMDDMRRLVLLVPVAVRSESNGRQWRQRSARTQAARKAVRKALGNGLHALAIFCDHYAHGRPLRVVLTKLGGRRQDKSNVPAALKATEDAIAYLLGADDGSPLWRVEWGQEDGDREGVRIELQLAEAP